MLKKRILLIRAILCVVTLGIASVFLYPSLGGQIQKKLQGEEIKPMKPDEFVTHYFSLVGEGQYEELYAMLSNQSQTAITEEDFIKKHKNIYDGIGAKNLTVTIEQVSDFKNDIDKIEKGTIQKMIEYFLRMDTIAGEIAYSGNMILSLNENKEYRIEWSPQTIFPSLTWTDKVQSNTLKAKRGCIYDRNGEMLAGLGTASSVGLVPGKMRKIVEDASLVKDDSVAENIVSDVSNSDINENASTTIYNEEDIARVAELLEITPESIMKKLNASYVKDDTFVFLKNVSMDEQELKDELLTVKGVLISTTQVRYYPLGEKASHLIGYIQGINSEELEVLRDQGYHMNSVLGKAGLEKIYEEQLRSIDGYEIIIVDDKGNVKETLARKEKSDGKDITITIDTQIQNQLYDLFCNDKSCSVAINPKTGEVLALVSTPTYNANDFVLGMSMSKWTVLNEDVNKPMYNRFKAALCPGSTFKAVTAAIGINTGIIASTDDFGYSGLKWRKDESWGGYYITTTKEYSGPANIENALMYSDNIYFGKAALKIGADLFAEQLTSIGFGERIPFEFGLNSSVISTTKTFTSEIQLADSGFGQGEILVNPIHLASIYSAFVNSGSMIQPYLIQQDTPVPEFWKDHVFTSKTARVVRDSLVKVVERGTATDAQVHGLTLGGKTGTAEVKQSKDDTSGTELGWFVLFTADNNVESPLLVVSMVEDVKGRGGSHYVSPKVKTVFEKRD